MKFIVLDFIIFSNITCNNWDEAWSLFNIFNTTPLASIWDPDEE
jgi:hypothetical protein